VQPTSVTGGCCPPFSQNKAQIRCPLLLPLRRYLLLLLIVFVFLFARGRQPKQNRQSPTVHLFAFTCTKYRIFLGVLLGVSRYRYGEFKSTTEVFFRGKQSMSTIQCQFSLDFLWFYHVLGVSQRSGYKNEQQKLNAFFF
jgi:hypothetical protein